MDDVVVTLSPADTPGVHLSEPFDRHTAPDFAEASKYPPLGEKKNLLKGTVLRSLTLLA